MSFLKKQFATTANDRRNKVKNKGETSAENEVQNQNGGPAPKPKQSKSLANLTGQTQGGKQNDVLPVENEICFCCNKAPRKNGGLIACRSCKKHFCARISCADLTVNTLKDLVGKPENILWFCNSCAPIVAQKLDEQMPITGTPSNGDLTSSDNTVTQNVSPQTELASVDTSAQGGSSSLAASLTPEADPIMKKIVVALEDLQVQVCGLQDQIGTKPQKPPTKTYAQRLAASIGKDKNQEKGIVVVNIDKTPENMQNESAPETNQTQQPLTEMQAKIQASLQQREKVKRPEIAAEIMEERELERRKNNIVIHNLAESNSAIAEERKDHDVMEVSCMLAGMRLYRVNVEKAIRLGNRSDDKPGPRSLLVTLDGERDSVIKRERFVRKFTDWKEVFIDPDRTPKQQEEHKSLFAEFKRRKEAGENLVFRNGKILKSTKKTPGAAAGQDQNADEENVTKASEEEKAEAANGDKLESDSAQETKEETKKADDEDKGKENGSQIDTEAAPQQ